MPGPTEADFEVHIVRALVEGGWNELTSADVPVDRPVIEADLAAFVRESQPAEWDKLESVHGVEAGSVLAQEVWRKVQRDGAIKVLRGAVRYRDASVTMAFGTPSNALNPELARQHGCNRFAVVRQVRCNPVGGDTVDLVLFLNGVAVATVELKNSLTGQDAHHACQRQRHEAKGIAEGPALIRIGLAAEHRSSAHGVAHPHEAHVQFLGPRSNAGNEGTGGQHRCDLAIDEQTAPRSPTPATLATIGQ